MVKLKLSCALAVAVYLFGLPAAQAQYPTETIKIINPFPPGAVTDMVAGSKN